MSRDAKSALIEALGEVVVRWQDATQRHDEAVGEIFGLNPAERLCLSFLWDGPKAASAIARHTRLTPAAVTALIDRLEKRGFVRRLADPNDRRKVLVEAGEEARRVTEEAYLPLGEAGAALLAKYSEAELRIVSAVLTESLALQEEMTRQLLARHGKGER
ncbi:putative HTH-type transcriptional regulator YcgE [Youhaiella tibetensis]|uniref:MarR family transcriptional regulator n=1 Tax=Paradevosia tibetensis TaxID=1447062 RepID=UPI000676D22A|nr:MarR family transcriptional regulator [Youhaiella tibetensis]AKR58092.1 MarR family transcriptional regulator [Devosia sp. H5989]GGF37636.1 putative HTH-type transcriptional regulator YcgE [Youhaiella tibetensis]